MLKNNIHNISLENIASGNKPNSFSYFLFSLQLFAIVVSYLLLNIAVVAATDVNILFNGQRQASTAISSENLVNRQVTIKHDASDITWTNVKALVNVNGASLANNIKKIYLFKCKNQNPVDCAKLSPQIFDRWVDTELLWSDISVRKTAAPYPQVANLLFLIEMESLNQKTAWTGFWTSIDRVGYNVFNQYGQDIGGIDINAKTMEFVNPIKTYIQTYNMIPFNWVNSVVFSAASGLFAIGGNMQEMAQSPPVVQTARPSAAEVSSVNKDFFIVFPETTSGASNPVTLNLNPSYTCGDGRCESDLGETSSNCCFDCGCSEGSYCDIANQTGSGRCRADNTVTLQVDVPAINVRECNQQFLLNLTTRISNAPSSLPAQLQGRVMLNNSLYNTQCIATQAGTYSCQIPIVPQRQCGAGRYAIRNNAFNFTLVYNDGPNIVTRDIGRVLDDISVNYDCSCQQGFYCDIARGCSPEASISLSVINVTSFLRNFNPQGDWIYVNAKVNNPPTDLAVVGTGYSLNGTTGSLSCQGSAAEGHIYSCRIPVNVPNYDHSKQYIYTNNSINFSVQFSSGPLMRTQELSSSFSDVLIPSYRCGDGTCNPEENSGNCCFDCGCPQLDTTYCDAQRGCQRIRDVGFTVDSINPSTFSDCQQPHAVNVTGRVLNPPSDMRLLYSYYIQKDQISGWQFSCNEMNPGVKDGLVSCMLLIPNIDTKDTRTCQLPSYTVGPNKLNLSVSWTDGPRRVLSKEFTSIFSNITIIPTFHCGDGVAEPEYGETAANCCIDVPCETDPAFGADYYCDYDPQGFGNGSCKSKSAIKLVVDSPVSAVQFDSCEITNWINIKAHIDNQPSNVQVENIVGELNNNSANVNCQQGQLLSSSTYAGGWSCVGTTYSGGWSCVGTNCSQYSSQANCINYPGCSWQQNNMANSCSQFTTQSACTGNSGCTWQPVATATTTLNLNCTMMVPREYECHQGNVYNYRNNKLGVFISYVNGREKSETQMISAVFADAVTTQHVRSLKDIIDEGVRKLRAEMYAILDAMNKALDAMDKCIKMMFVMALVTIVAAIGFGIWGTAEKGLQAGGELGGKVGIAGGLITKSISDICNMIQQWYKMLVEKRKMNVEMIKMELCLQVMQNALDTRRGQCQDSQIDTCWRGMLNCVDTSKMDSFMSSMSSAMGNIGTSANNVANNFQKIGEEFSNMRWWGVSAGANLMVQPVGGGPTDQICTHNGVQGVLAAIPSGATLQSFCRPNMFIVLFDDTQRPCTKPWLVVDRNTATKEQYLRTTQYDVLQRFGIPTAASEQHYISIYCDENSNNVLESNELRKETPITVLRANSPSQTDPYSCYCPNIKTGSTSAAGAAGGATTPAGTPTASTTGANPPTITTFEFTDGTRAKTIAPGDKVEFSIAAVARKYDESSSVSVYVKKNGLLTSDCQIRMITSGGCPPAGDTRYNYDVTPSGIPAGTKICGDHKPAECIVKTQLVSGDETKDFVYTPLGVVSGSKEKTISKVELRCPGITPPTVAEDASKLGTATYSGTLSCVYPSSGSSGSSSVTVTVTDSEGTTATSQPLTVTVTSGAAAGSVVMTGPTTDCGSVDKPCSINQDLTFRVEQPRGIIKYNWDCGNGETEPKTTAVEKKCKYEEKHMGTVGTRAFVVSVEAFDDKDKSLGKATKTITVSTTATATSSVTATITGPSTAKTGEDVKFEASIGSGYTIKEQLKYSWKCGKTSVTVFTPSDKSYTCKYEDTDLGSSPQKHLTVSLKIYDKTDEITVTDKPIAEKSYSILVTKAATPTLTLSFEPALPAKVKAGDSVTVKLADANVPNTVPILYYCKSGDAGTTGLSGRLQHKCTYSSAGNYQIYAAATVDGNEVKSNQLTVNVIVNDKPVVSSVTLNTVGDLKYKSEVTCIVSPSDDDDKPVKYKFEWLLDNTVINTATFKIELTDTLSLSSIRNVKAGQKLECKVTAKDNRDLIGEPKLSRGVVIQNTPPTITKVKPAWGDSPGYDVGSGENNPTQFKVTTKDNDGDVTKVHWRSEGGTYNDEIDKCKATINSDTCVLTPPRWYWAKVCAQAEDNSGDKSAEICWIMNP